MNSLVKPRVSLAILLGCGLRRAEMTTLKVEDRQQREEHRVKADLDGKGGHIRTIPIPDLVKTGIDAWMAAAGITTGALFRSIKKAGRIWGTDFSPRVFWDVVKQKAKDCQIPSLAPHDLRRTCARLCRQAGGELEQLQFLLEHVFVETEEDFGLQTTIPQHSQRSNRPGTRPRRISVDPATLANESGLFRRR